MRRLVRSDSAPHRQGEKLSPGRSGAERGGSLRRLSLPPRRQPRGTPRAKLPRPASTTDGGRSRLPRQRLRRHEKAPVERVARQRSVERSDATGNDLRPAAGQPMAK